MRKPADLSAHSTTGVPDQPRRKPNKATAAGTRTRPVQLSIFDYAAASGITLLPEAS